MKTTTTLKHNGFSLASKADALQALAVFLAVPGRKCETYLQNNVCWVRLSLVTHEAVKTWSGHGFTMSTAISEALRALPSNLRTSDARILGMPLSGAQLDALAACIVENVTHTEGEGVWVSAEHAVQAHEDTIHEVAAERHGRRLTPREWRNVAELAEPRVARLNSRTIIAIGDK